MSAEPIGAVKPNTNPWLKYRAGEVIGQWVMTRYVGDAVWVLTCTSCNMTSLLKPYEARAGKSCDFCKLRATAVEISSVRKAACIHFDVTHKDIVGPCRERRFSRPRMLAMALARELTNRSLPAIGRHFGGRDHTTVLHAMRRMAALREECPAWEEHYQAVKNAVVKKPLHVQEELEAVNV